MLEISFFKAQKWETGVQYLFCVQLLNRITKNILDTKTQKNSKLFVHCKFLKNPLQAPTKIHISQALRQSNVTQFIQNFKVPDVLSRKTEWKILSIILKTTKNWNKTHSGTNCLKILKHTRNESLFRFIDIEKTTSRATQTNSVLCYLIY